MEEKFNFSKLFFIGYTILVMNIYVPYDEKQAFIDLVVFREERHIIKMEYLNFTMH